MTKRTLGTVLMVVAILGVSFLTFSCSRQMVTAPKVSDAPNAVVYRGDGVRVVRTTDPGQMVVLHARFVVDDASGKPRFLDYATAARELADDAEVRVVEVKRFVRGTRLEQARDAAREAVPQADFVRGLLHPDNETPCACPCCSRDASGVCHCTWGCLKACYRGGGGYHDEI